MKVTEHIARADRTLFTFEILPPLKGYSIQNIHETIDPLIEFSPSFIDVTYHREEVVYKRREGGLLEKKTVRKRPGTVGITAAIKFKYKVDVVPHIICGGFSREDTEDALIDLNFLGVDSVLVIRGDNLKSEKYFVPDPDGHAYAIDLVNQVVNMNKGTYLDDELLNAMSTDFCIGVAGYPEKHVESPNLQSDIKYLKAKIEAGAEYIVTQMFFDNSKYYSFVERCRAAGITVPIIPGLKPLSTARQLQVLPQVFNIDIPDELVKAIEACSDNRQVRQVGVEWAIQQSKELVKFGVPVLHYYTMGASDNIAQIAREIF
jgi:methylenetetrahydrofolate reductase (NADPH)